MEDPHAYLKSDLNWKGFGQNVCSKLLKHKNEVVKHYEVFVFESLRYDSRLSDFVFFDLDRVSSMVVKINIVSGLMVKEANLWSGYFKYGC